MVRYITIDQSLYLLKESGPRRVAVNEIGERISHNAELIGERDCYSTRLCAFWAAAVRVILMLGHCWPRFLIRLGKSCCANWQCYYRHTIQDAWWLKIHLHAALCVMVCCTLDSLYINTAAAVKLSKWFYICVKIISKQVPLIDKKRNEKNSRPVLSELATN